MMDVGIADEFLNSTAVTTDLVPEVDSIDFCSDRIPSTVELFINLPTEGYILAAILAFFTLLTFIIYIEEVIFIRKHIRRGTRTMWVLACYPVFSICGLLGVFVPRSGIVVDMIAHGYFATCLYNFGKLMVRYMGGTSQLWQVFATGRIVTFNTLPACCCCICLPRPPFQMSVYNRMRGFVLQIVIVRPLLAFVAIVLWTDGTFQPGTMSPRNPYTYVSLANAVSTVLTIYGLMLLRNAFRPELEQPFQISGKIMSIQLALICSVLSKIIIGVLVSNDVIRCSPLFPSKARGEAIYAYVVVLQMLPLSLLGRRFFRRASDGQSYLDRKKPPLTIDGHAPDENDWESATETKL